MRKFKIGYNNETIEIVANLLSSFTKDDSNRYRYSLFANKSEFIFIISTDISFNDCIYINRIKRVRDDYIIDDLLDLILTDEDTNFDLNFLDETIELIRLYNKNHELRCFFANNLYI